MPVENILKLLKLYAMNVPEIRRQVINRLQKDFSHEASVTTYLDHILITVSEQGFEQKAAQLTHCMQQVINENADDNQGRLSVIIKVHASTREKELSLFKSN